VAEWLRATRRRAVAAAVLRSTAAALAVGSVGLVVAARVTGPVASPPTAALVWLVIAAACAAVVAAPMRGIRGLAGAGAARLLEPLSAALASQVRTAAELPAAPLGALGMSTELAEAHVRRTAERLRALPPAQVVPARAFVPPKTVAALLAALAALAVWRLDPVTVAGVWALTHPGTVDARGDARAAVVARVGAILTFPEYLGRNPVRLHDVESIEVPTGTSVELTVVPRIDARDGQVVVAGRSLPLGRRSDGSLVGEFVVREGGELRVRLRPRGRDDWLVDPRPRALRVKADQAPRVDLVAPATDIVVDAGAEVPVQWAVTDDVGIVAVELVVRQPDGSERRSRLAGFARDEHRTVASGTEALVPARFDAREGDQLVVSVEATDGDDVTGPHSARSQQRTITVGSAAQRHDQNLEMLEALLGLALGALADRLEAPPPVDDGAATARRRVLADAVAPLLARLEAAADALRRDARSRRADAARIERLARELRQADTREALLHRAARPPSHEARARADEAVVAALEETVLTLSNLLGRARIEDAATVAHEIEVVRRRIASLLAELRRAESEETRQALLAEIARAEQRMADLARRLASMATQVPSDFVNVDETTETAGTLEALREAVERGDLDAAARHLEALTRDVERLTASIASTRDGFVEARFGERERALAAAMDEVAGLTAEQRELARRSGEARRRALERAERAGAGASAAVLRKLEQRAREASDHLRSISPDAFAIPWRRSDLEQARQRVEDVRDALRSGDLAEAARMAEQAAERTDDLARGIAAERTFFGPRNVRWAETMRAAREADRRMRDLAREIPEATTAASDFVDGADREQLRADAPRQRRVREATVALRERIRSGRDGAPESNENVRALEGAADRMQAAERALERGDPRDAARAQEDALRQLEALRDQLENEARGGGQGSGGSSGWDASGGRWGGSGMARGEVVRIPGADEFRGPAERRRRVLDAMREETPRGWEDAMQRYYQEVLR
jgi:hypothetical protein